MLAARSLKSRWQRIDSRWDAPDRVREESLEYAGRGPEPDFDLESKPALRRLWGSFASTIWRCYDPSDAAQL